MLLSLLLSLLQAVERNGIFPHNPDGEMKGGNREKKLSIEIAIDKLAQSLL